MGAKNKAVKEKPLEKMTATELRDKAKEISDIVGAHGMNKAELVSAIKKAMGIEDTSNKKKQSSMRDIKKKIKESKEKHRQAVEAEDAKMAGIYRKRISRLKKKTRRVA